MKNMWAGDTMVKHWDLFLAPYKQAVEELKVKLRGIRAQFEMSETHSPIEFVTGRVKPIASILDKAQKKNIPLDRLEEEMQDIAGLRIMCQFVDDIKTVVKLLRQRNDFTIVEERDYVTQKRKRLSLISHCNPLPGADDSRREKHFGRNSNSHVGDEFLGDDRTFAQL